MYRLVVGVLITTGTIVVVLVATGHGRAALVFGLVVGGADLFGFLLFGVVAWWAAWPQRLRPPFHEWVGVLRGHSPIPGAAVRDQPEA